MKKLFLLTLALICLSVCALGVIAEDNGTITVYVTISDGEIQLARAEIALSDTDGDGQLTISDALYLAHEAAFDGGAEAGYDAFDGDWGLSLGKLWGIENGGSYGYYVNDIGAYSLTDPLGDGDYVSAFVYTDTVTWTDAYCYFDKNFVEAKPGDEVSLTLMMVSFDENWVPVAVPVAGAVILLDGEASEYVTGEDGSVTFTLGDETLISAQSDSLTLVPPVCVVAAAQ